MKPTFIPDRLIKARESLGLNKSQAAELMGLSPIGYLRYEQGLRVPSVQMLRISALTLNTSVDYLTGVSEDSSADQILISRSENSSLFELVREISNGENDQFSRLLNYYQKINSSSKSN